MVSKRTEARLDSFATPFGDTADDADMHTAMWLSFIAGIRTAHYGPLAAEAFAVFLAQRSAAPEGKAASLEAKSE